MLGRRWPVHLTLRMSPAVPATTPIHGSRGSAIVMVQAAKHRSAHGVLPAELRSQAAASLASLDGHVGTATGDHGRPARRTMRAASSIRLSHPRPAPVVAASSSAPRPGVPDAVPCLLRAHPSADSGPLRRTRSSCSLCPRGCPRSRRSRPRLQNALRPSDFESEGRRFESYGARR